MKKILCALLALLLLVGSTFTFASCNTPNEQKPNDTQQSENEDDNKQEKGEDQKDIVIPEGYRLYNDGTISFAYPENWTKQDGSLVILTGTNGNNITVVYEAKTDAYENLTMETFNSVYKPAYEAMGLTVSNVKIQKTTTNGLNIVQITQNTKNATASMKQTQYFVTLGDKTYTVTVTEVVSDAKLVSTVLETLKGVEK
jgi:hypothetical protein